jgi:hypothetical protein
VVVLVVLVVLGVLAIPWARIMQGAVDVLRRFLVWVDLLAMIWRDGGRKHGNPV